MPLTPSELHDLLGAIENACTMPTVPSRPLMELNDIMGQTDMNTAADDPLTPVIEAAMNLSKGWSFWPLNEDGSRLAVVADARDIVAVREALAKYRKTQQCP